LHNFFRVKYKQPKINFQNDTLDAGLSSSSSADLTVNKNSFEPITKEIVKVKAIISDMQNKTCSHPIPIWL